MRVRRYSIYYPYLLAMLTPAISLVVAVLLRPLIGATFLFLFMPGIALCAVLGGLKPGVVASIVSVLLANYFVLPPANAFDLTPQAVLVSLVFLLVALIISVLYESRHRAEREAERSFYELETTLRSIGDAVIATDSEGRVAFMNPVAEMLTGWRRTEAKGVPLTDVFHIINEQTRQRIPDPLQKVFEQGITVGLGNHTVLISRDNVERPINDSGAPIKNDETDSIMGAVLVFRDISAQRHRERMEQFTSDVTHALSSSLDFDQTLQTAVKLMVPFFADWASVALLTDDQSALAGGALYTIDPELRDFFTNLNRTLVYPIDERLPSVQALRSGEPKLIIDLPPETFDVVADPTLREMTRKLDIRSAIHVPLSSRGQDKAS
jgi:PAS domain S-box-containing protein